MTRIPAYRPPAPPPRPAAHLSTEAAYNIVGLRRIAGDVRLLETYRANSLRRARALSECHLLSDGEACARDGIARPVLS